MIADNLGAGDAASAGVRLVDLDLTPTAVGGTTTKLTATGNNITGNGYGVRNETGAGADQTIAFTATGNWWGHVAGPSIGLPKTIGDPVNGAAVNYSGFRTTPINAPTVPSRGGRRAPDGRARPARRACSPARDTLRALAADDFGVKSVAFAIGATDASAPTRPRRTASPWTPGAALEGHDRDADGDDHRLLRPDDARAGHARRAGARRRTRSRSATPTPPDTDAGARSHRDRGHADAHAGRGRDARRGQAAGADQRSRCSARSSKGRKLTLSGALKLPAGIDAARPAPPCGCRSTCRAGSSSAPPPSSRAAAPTASSSRCRGSPAAGSRSSRRAVETSGTVLARSAPQRELRVRR